MPSDTVQSVTVTCIGRDVSNRAVPMLKVVPGDEALKPPLSDAHVGERYPQISRRVLQSLDESFGVRISIRDVRPAERRHHSQPLQRCDQGTHRLAIIRVQHQYL